MMVYASLKENHFWKASGHKHPLCGRTHTSMQVNTSRNTSICPIRLFCLSIIKLNDCVGCATGASCAVTPWRSELIAGSLTIIIRLRGGRRIHILNGAWACGNFLFLARRRRQWLRHTVSLAELDRCQTNMIHAVMVEICQPFPTQDFTVLASTIFSRRQAMTSKGTGSSSRRKTP